MERRLTLQEQANLEKLNLAPKVENVVATIWKQEPKPMEPGLLKRIMGLIVGFICFWGSTVALFVNRIYPLLLPAEVMDMTMSLIRFFSMVVFSVLILVKIITIVTLALDKTGNKVFSGAALEIWREKKGLYAKVRNLNKSFLIVGFVINKYFWCAGMGVVCFLFMAFIDMGVREDVKKAMARVMEGKSIVVSSK